MEREAIPGGTSQRAGRPSRGRCQPRAAAESALVAVVVFAVVSRMVVRTQVLATAVGVVAIAVVVAIAAAVAAAVAAAAGWWGSSRLDPNATARASHPWFDCRVTRSQCPVDRDTPHPHPDLFSLGARGSIPSAVGNWPDRRNSRLSSPRVRSSLRHSTPTPLCTQTHQLHC